MKKKTLRILYYIAWIIGLIAVGFLVYGIIKALI
jgi:predicted outer membrane lipoprotein